jgi:hypothetical protein
MFQNPDKILVKVPSEALTDLVELIYAEHLLDNTWIFHTKTSLEKSSDLINSTMSDLLQVDSSIHAISYLAPGDTAIRLNIRHNWKSSFELQNQQSTNMVTGHTEWQKNQYNPGHFTGGKTPEWMHEPGNKKALGWYYLIPSVFTFGILMMMIVGDWNIGDAEGIMMMTILTPLSFIIGLKYLLKK